MSLCLERRNARLTGRMTTCETPLSRFSIVPGSPDCLVVVEEDWLSVSEYKMRKGTYHPRRILTGLLACLDL